MVEKIVARSDRGEHLADGAGGGVGIARAFGSSSDYGFAGGRHSAELLIDDCRLLIKNLGLRRLSGFNQQSTIINQQFYFPHPPRERRRNSSTAPITTLSGTSAAISTLPISRGNTKCTTPPCVFLSA